jgi:hypothetical protein
MKFVVRCPLVSLAALSAYLLVYVLASAVHHHGAAGPLASSTELQYQTTDAADSDDEETCFLCAVLHQSQIAPTALHVEAATTLNSDVLCVAALIRPHPLETAIYSRGPPLI